MHLKKWVKFIFLAVLMTSISFGVHAEKKDKRAEIVVDVKTGRILHSYKSDHIRHPASLTKLMTLYLMFEALDSGKVTPTSRIVFSEYAASKPPSKLGIKVGKSITVRDAAYTLIIRSANDVSTAIAEKLGGSEAKFARMMTKKARKLGMTRTVFKNASGLPDNQQVTTAEDMAVLALRLMQDFPHYYKYFKTLKKNVAGIPLKTHNHLLKEYDGMDGMKTGYINMSGFNLVSSAERKGQRLLTVVFGGKTAHKRDKRVALLTDIGWKRLKNPRGYRQFIGLNLPRIASLKSSFRPLEASSSAIVKTASLLPQAPKVQRIAATKYSSKSAQYNLQAISEVDKGGWQEVKLRDNLPKAPEGVDEIALLIEQSNTKLAPYTGNNTSNSLFNKRNTPQYQLPSGGIDMEKATQNTINNRKNKSSISQDWTIQVGAFSQKSVADNYLTGLIQKFNHLSQAQPELIAIRRGNDYIYRARLSGFTPQKAREACRLLKKNGRHCILANASS